MQAVSAPVSHASGSKNFRPPPAIVPMEDAEAEFLSRLRMNSGENLSAFAYNPEYAGDYKPPTLQTPETNDAVRFERKTFTEEEIKLRRKLEWLKENNLLKARK